MLDNTQKIKRFAQPTIEQTVLVWLSSGNNFAIMTTGKPLVPQSYTG